MIVAYLLTNSGENMKKVFKQLIGLVGLQISLMICMPVMANEKVALCEEYVNHLSSMKKIQLQQNFSSDSKQWKDAVTKREALKKKGKEFYGNEVKLVDVCSGLLHMMKSKQYQNYR